MIFELRLRFDLPESTTKNEVAAHIFSWLTHTFFDGSSVTPEAKVVGIEPVTLAQITLGKPLPMLGSRNAVVGTFEVRCPELSAKRKAETRAFYDQRRAHQAAS